MDKILEVKNVDKSFGKKQVIKNISFAIHLGEVVGFLGPNGAGKSVTIKMIVGLLRPDHGKILIQQYDITKKYEAAMEQVGAIVENPDLFEYLTGYDHMKLVARVYQKSEEKIKEVIQQIGLEKSIKNKVKTYSLGMKQRLAIGLALIRDPKLLILDEPTNGLDPAGIHELRNMVKKLAHEQKIAVFVSSHLLSEMELMCDRVIMIHHGQIIKEEKMNDELEEQYVMTTSHNEEAKVLLKESGYFVVEEEQEKILLKIKKEAISRMLTMLLNHHIAVYEIKQRKTTLEDLFLDVTEGESHA